MTLSEAISDFKKSETAENIVPLVESEELRNGLVAWKSVVISFKDVSGEPPKGSDAARWDWMWSQVEFELNSFAIVSGVQNQYANKLFTRLKGLRLIYPDGTIHELAAKYLQSIIMSKLPKPKS